MKKNNNGFTLIELLVVIAILGILAGVLYAFINPQKRFDESQDAKIKHAIASIGSQVSIVYTNSGDYNNVCDTENIKKLGDFGSGSGDTGVCNDGANFWVVSRKLTGENRFWCTDSNGNKKELSSQITNTQTEC